MNVLADRSFVFIHAIEGHHRISPIARDTLTALREDLGFTTEEAQNIETHAFKPYHEYENKLKKYEQTLRKVIPQYPFSEEIKTDFQFPCFNQPLCHCPIFSTLMTISARIIIPTDE